MMYDHWLDPPEPATLAHCSECGMDLCDGDKVFIEGKSFVCEECFTARLEELTEETVRDMFSPDDY